MKIKKHRLYLKDNEPAVYKASPNYRGNIRSHDFIVLHYTAGTSAQSSIAWLTSKRAKASAHLVIARDGNITQLVPFNKCAWHAGNSEWGNRVGLNKYSIGIEMDNAGKLTQQGEKWKSWSGHTINKDDVIMATHKNESTPTGWHTYTQAQIEAALMVSETLAAHYPSIKDIIGHDDIAPIRKIDPGPAFPMDSFASRVIGRSADEDDIMHVTTNLNIRSGPGTENEKITKKPLPKGTRVLVNYNYGNWRFVSVIDIIEGDNDLEGWVHGRYLGN